jgi:hypothetical protein
MHTGDGREEEALVRHRKKHARRRQHDAEEATERRDGDDNGDQADTDLAERRLHRVCGDERRLCEATDRVDVHVGQIRRQINGDDGECPADDGARQCALRIGDFAAGEREVSEPVVGPQH